MFNIQFPQFLINNRFVKWVKNTKPFNEKDVDSLKKHIFNPNNKNPSMFVKNKFCLLSFTLAIAGTTFLISKKSNLNQKEQVSEEFAESFWAAKKINNLEKPWAHLESLKFDQETINHEEIEIKKRNLKYHSPKVLYNKRVEVREGLLYQVNGKLPLHCKDIYDNGMFEGTQWFNYVMFKDGTLVVDQEKQMYNERKPLVNHYSLAVAHEEPVAAGEIKIKEGRVDGLNEFSGHFKPKYRVQYVQEQLRSMGATFSKNFKIYNYNQADFLVPILMDPRKEQEFLEKKVKEIEDHFNDKK